MLLRGVAAANRMALIQTIAGRREERGAQDFPPGQQEKRQRSISSGFRQSTRPVSILQVMEIMSCELIIAVTWSSCQKRQESSTGMASSNI